MVAELRAQAQRLQEEAERERSRQLAVEAEAQSELLPLPLPLCVATHAMITSKCCKLWVMMACRQLSWGWGVHRHGGQGGAEVSAV